MSSEKATTTEAKGATQKDAMFFFHILNNMRNAPDVDWDVVADKAGYNNAGTAKTRFGQIKKKLGALDSGSPTTPKTSRILTKQKAGEIGSGTNVSPSKVIKKRGRKPKVEVKDEVYANEQEDGEMDTTMMNEGADYGKSEV